VQIQPCLDRPVLKDLPERLPELPEHPAQQVTQVQQAQDRPEQPARLVTREQLVTQV
jgi:hypothetical protein